MFYTSFFILFHFHSSQTLSLHLPLLTLRHQKYILYCENTKEATFIRFRFFHSILLTHILLLVRGFNQFRVAVP